MTHLSLPRLRRGRLPLPLGRRDPIMHSLSAFGGGEDWGEVGETSDE